MGSVAISTNVSNTAYTNAPISQSDVTNPLNLLNSANAMIGSTKTDVKGNLTSTVTTLDGGAIEKAFNFGENVIGVIADITRSNNAGVLASNTEAMKIATQAQASLDKNANMAANSDWMQNKSLIYTLGAVLFAFFYFKGAK